MAFDIDSNESYFGYESSSFLALLILKYRRPKSPFPSRASIVIIVTVNIYSAIIITSFPEYILPLPT
jgi:hypothetical protein